MNGIFEELKKEQALLKEEILSLKQNNSNLTKEREKMKLIFELERKLKEKQLVQNKNK